MAWNSSLSDALRYTEFVPSDSSPTTHPTATEAAAIWEAKHLYLKGRLLSAGLTIPASGDALTLAQDLEALCASAEVQGTNEVQEDGKESDYTASLRKRCAETLDKLCAEPAILEQLGATFDDDAGSHPASLQTDYPSSSEDTSTYESPMAEWERDGDF